MNKAFTIPEPENDKYFDWHNFSRKAILVCKLFILFFIICIIATITIKFLIPPYSYYLVGIEICITVILSFTLIRMSTYRPIGKLILPDYFITTNKEAELLWINITNDINKYEEGATYYFNSVKIYKYLTIFLSGLSTILLGLDLGGIPIWFMDYTTFSKNSALIISAIITITTTLFTYWNIEKYWLINKTIVNKLKALRDELEMTCLSSTVDVGNISDKIKKHYEIKETFNKYWEGALSERNEK